MLAFYHLLVLFVVNPFRPRRQVEIENLFLRYQLNIALRRAPYRLRLRTSDRTLLTLMTWPWPSLIAFSRLRELIRRMSQENRYGVRREFMESCSSSALKSPSRWWPDTRSSNAAHPVRDGAPFCATMHPKSRPWICSWSRPSGSSSLIDAGAARRRNQKVNP
jgi:hypothetical protein